MAFALLKSRSRDSDTDDRNLLDLNEFFQVDHPMRVRPKRNLITRRPDRSVHPAPRPAVVPDPAPVDHPHERRARESGGPIDNAQYNCSCGLVFDAAVSTSVACPHCGTDQAW
jgi:hypothetical protein